MRFPSARQAVLISISLFFSLAYAEPPNLSLLKKEVIQYHDSGAYSKDISSTVSAARKFLRQRVEQNQKEAHPQKLAIVFDIDETCLSNYNTMFRYGFSMNQKQLHAAITAADDPAITPVLQLFREANQKKVSIFFVTGRPDNELAATEKNLRSAGFTSWNGLFLKPLSYNKSSIVPFKAGTRAKIEKEGYTIVASIGDQYSDLQGGHAEKIFKLPNPYYFLP